MSASLASAQVNCVWDLGSQLGEGPVWVAQEEALYFVDILGRLIHRWRNDERRSWSAPAEPGFIFSSSRGGFVCGMRGGLYRFDPSSGSFSLLIAVEAEHPAHRINDGFVDAEGMLWFGTMHEDTLTRGGALYSLERGPALKQHDAGYIVTNGPVVSPDGATLYHNDSAQRTVYAFDLEARSLSNRRTFITFPAGIYPDGMAVDAQGCLWIALFNGWGIERYSPTGEKIGQIALPCANVTKLAFGGGDLRTLYVTTASAGLSPEDHVNQPLAGGLFSVEVPIRGRPASAVSLGLS